MSNSLTKIWRKLWIFGLLLGGFGIPLLYPSAPATAAAGINAQMNFQGRLLNAQGAIVPDGYYNVEFKIYQGGDGQTVGDTGGTLEWTEDYLNNGSTQGVKVQNGFLSVQLGSLNPFGSQIDWNSDTLWLSMQVGNTSICSISTNFQTDCGGDGEMVPMKRLSSNAYAMNAGLLGGLNSTQFLQLGQGVQTDAGNATSLFVNKTGTGNILNLQSGGNDAFIINNSGDINFGATSNHNIAVMTAGAGVAGRTLTLTAGGAGSGGTALAGGNLVLQGGSGGGTNGNGGSISIDAGVKNGTGTDGTISIGTTTASGITIGKLNMTTNIGGSLAINSALTIGSAAGNGSLTNNGSTINSTLVINDLASGGVIGTAAATVDAYTSFGINQVTADQALSLPDPTASTAGRIIYVSNVGSTSFTLLGTKLNAGSTAAIVWNGTAWSMAGAPTDAILNQSASAQSANFYVRSAANNKIAAVIEGANGQAVNLISINTYDGTSSSTVTSFDSKGYLHFNKAAAVSDSVVAARVNGDTNDRFTVGADGKLSWGAGNAAADVTLSRSGNGQATLGGSLTVSSGLTVGSINSTAALQVQNGNGKQVFGVDTTNSQVLLGQSNQTNGALVFKTSSSANAITLNATAVTSTYTLTLPAAAPAAGLCLETSTGNAAQLVFASCANNNSSITEVQTWDANNTNTMTITPSAVGDEIVLTTQIPTAGVTVSSITGGGVSSWNKVVANNGNGTVNRVEMWVGTVTSVAPSTVTVNYSAAPGTEEVTATEFTAAGVNSSTSWGIESFSSQLNSTASSTVTFPGLTAVNGSELYVGYAQVQNPPGLSGNNSNFNYIVTSTQHNVITYDPVLSANTAYQPTAAQSSAGQSNTVGAVLTAFVTSTSINNTTSLQKANFYVQAASNGSVAGILQAASAGTADVLNVRSSGADTVMSIGYTGVATFRNSSDSPAAFQVQNSDGNTILGVNTSANQAFLGTAGVLGGALTFNNASNLNTITLTAPTTVAANYTLSLPSNTPTAGLCLGTSLTNANQLIFASCATQVSAASISYVNKWGNSGTSVTTVADAPVSIGDLLVFYSHSTNNVSITKITGGGVTNWTKVTSNTGATGQGNDEMWRGVVTSVGSGTITVTYSGAAGVNDITAQEFTMGSAGGTWAVDTSGTTTGSSATVSYPTLTPMNSSELYTGYAWSANTMSAGTTTGFTYLATNASKYVAYNTNVTSGTPLTPTASQSASGNYNSIGALIAAYAGTSVIVNSTATQQANFNVQAALSGTVAGVLQAASSGTADILQLKNGSGINVATVNGDSGLTLGTSASLGGQLSFAASNNNNLITILAPEAPGSSYQLILPTTTPAAGQCLASSPNNATQLVFSSCANQVTSVPISFVANWSASGSGNSMSLSTSPVNKGDLIVLFVTPQKSNTVSSVTGGGVGTWSKISSTISGTGIEMWRGQVTTPGASTIDVTLSGPNGTNELAAMEFTTGENNGSWVVDTSNTQVNGSDTTVTYPSLTPQSTKDLYVGYAATGSTASAGSTSGYNYVPGDLSNRMGLYNTAVSATTQPTALQSSSSSSVAVGALIAAYSSSSVIANSTVTQEANLNVQSALDDTVAAVFQAASSGSADVLDILDASGTLVDGFSNTGNLLVKPSTPSADAFHVQTTGGTDILSVDNGSSLVVVGAGATGESTPSLLVLDSRTGTNADPTVLNGAMYYNATSQSFRCGVDGSWQTCSGLLYSNSSKSSSNSNCSTNCTAFSTAASIPANYCQTGRVIKLMANGYFSSLATPSNLQFGVYYGTDGITATNDTLIGSLSPAESVTSASNNYFQMNFNIICFSTSTMMAQGMLNLQTGATGTGMITVPMASTAGTTVATSSANNLYIFPLWDTASTSNTATITQFTVNAD